MTRARKLLERLDDIFEQDDEMSEEPDEDEEEDDEEDSNPFSKENRNSDGSIKTKGKVPINDKNKK